MSARQSSLSFNQPLRQVHLRAAVPVPAAPAQDLQAIEQAAYQRGRHDAEAALRQQLLQQRAEFEALEKGVLDALRGAVSQVIRDTEQALTLLALEAAQRLVAGLPVSVQMVEAAVREALAQAQETAELHLYLHPEDLELLRRADSALLRPTEPGARLHLHPSPEITRGGCLVRTRFGIIDSQRETKIELLKKAVLA
jgi:flagellar assembly protein FliH